MIPEFLYKENDYEPSTKSKFVKLSFIDKTLKNISLFVSSTIRNFEDTIKKGLFQQINTRIKIIIFVGFIVTISLIHLIFLQGIIFCLILVFTIASRLNLWTFYRKIFLLTLFFGLLPSFLGSLNIFVKGSIIISIVKFSKEHTWWIYHLPKEIGITYEGIKLVSSICLKIFNSLSIAFLLIRTTTFEQISKSLIFFKVPVIISHTLILSYKFIFILSHTIDQSFKSLKMRWWGNANNKQVQEVIAGRAGYLFSKASDKYTKSYQAMIARGFNGHFYYFVENLPLARDYIIMALIIILLVVINIINIIYG